MIGLGFAAEFSSEASAFIGQALILSTIIIAIFYALAIVFKADKFKMKLHQEIVQLCFTAFIASQLVALTYFWENQFVVTLPAITGRDVTVNLSADSALSTFSSYRGKIQEVYRELAEVSKHYGKAGTKFLSCQLNSGFVISYSACGSYSILSNLLSTYSSFLSMALQEMGAITYFLSVAKDAFLVLVPLGLFLRSFSISRGIGNFCVALGLSFYTVLPGMLMFLYALLDPINENYYFSFSHPKNGNVKIGEVSEWCKNTPKCWKENLITELCADPVKLSYISEAPSVLVDEWFISERFSKMARVFLASTAILSGALILFIGSLSFFTKVFAQELDFSFFRWV